jgi:hypothetical protein
MTFNTPNSSQSKEFTTQDYLSMITQEEKKIEELSQQRDALIEE